MSADEKDERGGQQHRSRIGFHAVARPSDLDNPGGVMTKPNLTGVIAAIATAVDEEGEPDCARSCTLARFLLAHGCDGLNVLGTTGEATSFSLEQRRRVMTAYRDAGLPLDRLMVGTGAAAVADAVTLTRHAAELGFAAALVLPPFYYKGIPDDGLVAYIEAIVTSTAAWPIPIYLYHFPAQSGLAWHVRLIERLLGLFGTRIVGLKDSSGDMGYAREAAAVASGFQVFPSTEAVLIEARSGTFAGCISATANLNADLCARAWRNGDVGALQTAVAIRKLFDGKQLVPGVKALLAHIHRDPTWQRVAAPLSRCPAAEAAAVATGYDDLRAHTRASTPVS
jgi:4-hydroxy-tetrahydrodipicolinate synthase